MIDAYRPVTTRFRGISPSGKAVFVDLPSSRGAGSVSIPRSLIHAGDDLQLDRYRGAEGTEITFRLREWKAEEIGFA